jgi:hypothetical protein
MRMRRICHIILIVLVAVVSALISHAAPIGPQAAPKLPDEVRSLAGLKQLKINIEHNGVLPAGMEYSTKDAKEIVRQLLTDGGFEVVDLGQAPTVKIMLLTGVNHEHDNLVNYTFHLSLEQHVIIQRINAPLYVLTYALIDGDIATRAQLSEELEQRISRLTSHLMRRIHKATISS